MGAPAFNTVAWFEVAAGDPDGAQRFYGRLFGWTFAADPDGAGRYDLIRYAGQETGVGGVRHADGPDDGYAVFYVIVQDVAKVCAEAEKSGGKVTMPPSTAPSGLVFALLTDPAGNQFGIFTPPAA